jgi:drug/metabolite transporter (DMT)-like permease
MWPAFLTTLLFAVSGVAANRTTRQLGGIEANFYRITLAALLLALWAHTMGSGLSGKAFPYFLLSGCVGFGFGDLALYQTLPRLGSRLSVLLVHCLAAPFAALAEWVWLGTGLSGLQIISSLTILAGVVLALAPSEHLNLSRRMLWSGLTFGIVAALGQGFGAVLSRKAYQIAGGAGEHIDGLSAAYQRIVAGWLVAAVIFAMAKWSNHTLNPYQHAPVEKGRHFGSAWLWVFINALAGPTLGVGCFQWALSTRPTGVVLPIVATTPIAVIPLARIMEGERPPVRSLVGGAIAVTGAVALAGGAELILKIVAGWRTAS